MYQIFDDLRFYWGSFLPDELLGGSEHGGLFFLFGDLFFLEAHVFADYPEQEFIETQCLATADANVLSRLFRNPLF